MIRLPANNEQWSQPNNSDKFGSLWATKNINLDEEGYIKLSPRTIMMMNEKKAEATGSNFGMPLAIGRYGSGSYQVATSSNANWVGSLSVNGPVFTEDTGTANPTLTTDSHGAFWQNRWYVTTDTGMFYKTGSGSGSSTWTDTSASLTTSVPHFIEVFLNRTQICVTNGNTVKQYNTSYTTTQDLTLPADFITTMLAYNNDQMAVATKVGSSTVGQNRNAYLFIWNGATANAGSGFDTGSTEILAVRPYKSSFVLLTRAGQILYFNGGGFDVLASFPFYFEDRLLSGLSVQRHFGEIMSVDGDVVYIHLTADLDPYGRKGEHVMTNNPSGVWCYDPRNGLYHRWSQSISTVTPFSVTAANVNTSTDIMTVSSGTLPSAGSVVRYVDTGTTAIGGLTQDRDYWLVRLSDTTFQLADTKEKALDSVYIDLTSDGTSGTHKFLIYDIVDYGVSYTTSAAAVAQTGETTPYYSEAIFGGESVTVAGAADDGLYTCVPWLENRGWAITPKIFSNDAEINAQKLYIKYRPLKTGDSIIVKARTENIEGIPVSVPCTAEDTITWSSTKEFYTIADLSEAKTYLDAGNALECEITSGAGAGVMSQVVEINYDSGTYSVVLADEIIGVSAGNLSTCIIENWKVLATIDSNGQGYAEVPVSLASKWIQFKFELRGDRTTIERIDIIDTKHKDNA